LWSSAQAAPSPACTAAAASTAATAAAPGPAATASAAPTATSANNNNGQLHFAAGAFLVEEMERGETDVGHFLFAKNEALIGRDVVSSRDISRGYRVC